MIRFQRSANRLGLLAFLALGACAGKPYARPEMALPQQFRNAPSAAAMVAVDPRWWRSFGDPVLDRLVDQALSDSLTLEVAAARLDQAAAGLRAARASRLPLLNGQVSATEQRASIADQVGQGVSRAPGFQRAADVYNLGLSASWEIDLFGRLAAANRAARADLAAAQANVAGARLTVAAEVASAYLDARELQARLAVAKARVGTLGELDRLVKLRVSRGVAARLEGDQAAADLAGAQAAIPALEAALEAQYNRIDVLLGRVPGAARADLGAGAIPAAPIINAEGGPAALLFRRPDLAAAERAVAAADARVAQALAERWPRLNLAAAIGVLSAGTSNLFTERAMQTSVSGTLSGPVLDFGRNRASVARARAVTREAVANYRLAVLNAAAEAESNLAALARRRDQAQALAESATALDRARIAARTAYQAGAVSLIEALDAERRLQAAQDSLATARADTARAAVSSFRALGGGWQAGELARK
ncbi:MAG: hypothetical protein A4S16_01335 [Proteobacteria bacterium SG_bin6]|nr:MAG: hypothetical protein A4S16_01335 [Proteobacteria bacterium SG_bin6]